MMPSEDNPHPVAKHELAARLDRFMSDAALSGFSGSALAAVAGEVVLHRGYGLANRQPNRPTTEATLFDTGSVCKMFTAAAILKLQEESRLSVADTIGDYIEGVPIDKRGITLHHLLTHTSGLHLYSGDDDELISRDDMVHRIMATDLQWPPGTRYRYSNPAYGLLGVIIEIVTGQSYESYVHQHFFLKAGMLETGYVIPAWDMDRVAHGYEDDEDSGSPLDLSWLPDGPGWNLRACGGMLSTSGDLYKWHLAMQDGLLSEASQLKMFTAHVEAPSTPPRGSFSGYGVYVSTTPWGTRRIARGGTSQFGNTQYWYYPAEDVVLVLTTNTQHSTDWLIQDTLINVIFGDPVSADA